VTGKAEIMMAAAHKLFISSTFFPNSEGFVAALKTIEILERDNVLGNIWDKGGRFMGRIRELIAKHGAGAMLTGVAPMFFITFEKNEKQKARRTEFFTQLIRRGIFFTPHHHGYICYRHTQEDLDITAKAIDESLAYVKEAHGG
jgi:glutamate-1-semialdehyde aminotransferase